METPIFSVSIADDLFSTRYIGLKLIDAACSNFMRYPPLPYTFAGFHGGRSLAEHAETIVMEPPTADRLWREAERSAHHSHHSINLLNLDSFPRSPLSPRYTP